MANFHRHSRQIMALLLIFTASFTSLAGNISFPVPRPAFTQQAHDQFLKNRYRILGPESAMFLGEKCPSQLNLIRKIFARISNSNNIDYFLEVFPRIIVNIQCFGKEITSTGMDHGGILNISGAVAGKASDEDQIAFILAHEISHYLLAHDEQRIYWEQNDYSPSIDDLHKQELDADILGLQLMVNAGFAPSAAPDTMKFLLKEAGDCLLGHFCIEPDNSMHPSLKERKRQLISQIKEQGYVRKTRTITEDLLRTQREWKKLVK